MKKKLSLLFILISFSAFAFSFNYCSHIAATTEVKAVKKTPCRSGIAPLADLALLPALIG